MQKKLALFLAVTTIVASDKSTQECSELTSKQKFEPDKYFTGSWFVTHIKIEGRTLENKDLSCMEFKSEKLSNNTIREILAHYYPNESDESNKFVYIENHISEESFKEKKGRYTAQYRSVDKEGKMNYKDFSPITYTIRDTDYNSYSILNVCEIWDNGKLFSMDLITSRTLNDKNEEKVKSQVNTLKLNLDKFSALKDLNCVKDTNFHFTKKKQQLE